MLLIFCMSAIAHLHAQSLNIGAMVQPVSEHHRFINKDYHIWGASVVVGYDGKYHMYYSRWAYELGHMGWVTDSEIAYAVADHAAGPYQPVNVALPARGPQFWDGTTTHNPTVFKQDGKYYLYYMGTTAPVKAKQPTSMQNNDWWVYRNNQRIGVAWSENPEGPWHRLDQPVIDVSTDANATDALMVSNPAVNLTPDGKVFAVYKAVGKPVGWKPIDLATPKSWQAAKGSRVRYRVAFADNPLGPFTKQPETIFELEEAQKEHMIAEDPYVWSQGGQYYAIVCDIQGRFTSDVGAFALMESVNGYDWQPAKHPLVLPSRILKSDGTRTTYKLERPQLLVEDGKPSYLFGALGITVNGVHRGHACNLRVPLKNTAK